MFELCTTTTERGSVGEARAIYEFVKRGWVVSTPINDKAKYDLILDNGLGLHRVQVKTTCNISTSGGFEVKLSTTYANRSQCVIKHRGGNDYDMLFILAGDGSTWLIPCEDLGDARSAIVVGAQKWDEFRLR